MSKLVTLGIYRSGVDSPEHAQVTPEEAKRVHDLWSEQRNFTVTADTGMSKITLSYRASRVDAVMYETK